MKHTRTARHAVARWLPASLIMLAALAMAACSGSGSSAGSGTGDSANASTRTIAAAGTSTATATLEVTALLDGHDVSADSMAMVADANGKLVAQLQPGPGGLDATLPPGKYKLVIAFQGDYKGDIPPMRMLDVELGAGRTTTRKVTLEKGLSIAAMQLFQQMAIQAAANAAAGMQTPAGTGRVADSGRLPKFATCAGLPQDYFGDPGDSNQPDTEPKFRYPEPKPVAMPSPPHATPMQAAFDTMWVNNMNAAAIAGALETTIKELRQAIIWGDQNAASKLVDHASKLLPRLAAADKASRLAEARLLRLQIAPLLQDNPPPMLDINDPVGMARAFTAWQQNIKKNGLPPQTVAKLKAAGWTDEQITAMTADAIRAPVGQVVPETITGTVMAVATIVHDERGAPKAFAAAGTELDKLRKGVTHCGQNF